MKSTRDSTNTATVAGNPVVKTFGEIFADGSMLDVVATATNELSLVFFDGKSIRIDTQFEHAGRIYQVQELPPGILQATRLPREPAGYGAVRELFTGLRDAFEKYLGFSCALAEASTFWVLSTWFSDCLSNPPILWVQGADVDLATSFFQLLHSLCRRSLRLTGIDRAGFLSLPFDFHPVLLVNQPGLPVRLQDLMCESNSRGSVVLGSRGRILDATSSKAIFLGMVGTAPPPSAGNFHIALFPADHELPVLDDRLLNTIADDFQPRLMQYRLDHAKEVRESQFVVPNLLRTRELARTLAACIQGDSDLALLAVPVARSQDEMVNRCSLDYAIIAVLWPRLHSRDMTAPPAEMKIAAQLTAEVNTYLLSCGETRQYSREAVGKRVAKFELSLRDTNSGTLLLLDRQTSRRIHALARGYEIDKNVPGCPDCRGSDPSLD